MQRQRLVAIVTIVVHLMACSAQRTASDSQVRGFPGQEFLSQIANKSPAVLKHVAQSLMDLGYLSKNVLYSMMQKPQEGRSYLQKQYVSTLVKFDGIPHKQGLGVLTEILTDQTNPCAGAPCSKVFGLKAEDAEGFFEETLAKVATNREFQTSTSPHEKNIILASLLPLEVPENIKTKGHKISMIYGNRALDIPNDAEPEIKRLPAYKISKIAGKDFSDSVVRFTQFDSESIRLAESLSDEELTAKGWKLPEIAKWRKESQIINEGLAKLPSNPGRVFRGLATVDDAHLASWYDKWKNKIPIGLGLNDIGATSSTSIKSSVALDFALDFGTSFANTSYKVLLIIDHKSGVSIQNLSTIPFEDEVLIPRKARFLIKEMGPTLDRSTLIQIRLEEIQASASKFWNATSLDFYAA